MSRIRVLAGARLSELCLRGSAELSQRVFRGDEELCAFGFLGFARSRQGYCEGVTVNAAYAGFVVELWAGRKPRAAYVTDCLSLLHP